MAETIEQELRMKWGDEPVWIVTVTDAEGEVVNITGATMRFTAKARATDADADAVFTKTVGAGITLSDPLNGVASVVLTDTDTTSKLAPGRQHRLLFDWRMTLAGQTITVAYGTIVVAPSIARAV